MPAPVPLPVAKWPPQRQLAWLWGLLEPDRRSQASAAVDACPRQDELRSQPAIADSLAGRQGRDHRVRIIPKNSSGS